ncbi:hypothetical protein STVA_43430 [Allostella vacuolata]|nr:hypothetical protein STVA_43430 [Stella vacuolata]
MCPILILPGLGGSGPDHWQSRWQAADPAAIRFAPANWERPDRADWLAALDRAVADAPAPPILVAHSLACLLVAHWAAAAPARVAVRGAFLVGVPDPDGPAFPDAAAGFRDPPAGPLPFPALVVASADDPYGGIAHARARASQWRAGFVAAGRLGHVNAASGLGDWPQGAALLAAFRAGLGG